MQIPAFVDFAWEPPQAHRRLLNLEKVQFRADADGRSPGLLCVSARREGVHRDGPDAGIARLYYNIGKGWGQGVEWQV